MLDYSQDCVSLVKSFEQCRLVAYPDEGGVWTIGWGCTTNVVEGQSITQIEADNFLLRDLNIAWLAANRLLENAKEQLNQHQVDAVVDFVYNCGQGNFARSTLLGTLIDGNFPKAALEFEKWIYIKGKISEGLKKRRKAEHDLFLKGMGENNG